MAEATDSAVLIFTEGERLLEVYPLGRVEVVVVDLDAPPQGPLLLRALTPEGEALVEYPDLMGAARGLRDLLAKGSLVRAEVVGGGGKPLLVLDGEAPSLLILAVRKGIPYDLAAVAPKGHAVSGLFLEERAVRAEVVEGNTVRTFSRPKEAVAFALERRKEGREVRLRFAGGDGIWEVAL